MYSRLSTRSCAMLCCTLTISVFAGCSTDSTNEQQSKVDQVDPRFATSEALVAHISSLTEQDEPDFRGYYDLFYPETAAQESWDRFADEYILPTTEFHFEVMHRFGSGADDEKSTGSPGFWRTKNLRLVENGEYRAKAVFESRIRDDEDIYLIRIDGRWWVSGYTWEYHPMFDAEAVNERARMIIGLRRYIDEVIEALRADEFSTAKEARQAFQNAIRRHANEG